MAGGASRLVLAVVTLVADSGGADRSRGQLRLYAASAQRLTPYSVLGGFEEEAGKESSRLLSLAARRSRYRNRPRWTGGEVGPSTDASSPGVLLRRGSDIDVDVSSALPQNHPERVVGEAPKHARWSAERCWSDESG